MLSSGVGRFVDANPGAPAVGYFRAAVASGHRDAGFAGVLYDGLDWTRRRTLRIFQQYADFSTPSCRRRTRSERRRGVEAAGYRASGGPGGDADVFRGGEADADCAGAGT